MVEPSSSSPSPLKGSDKSGVKARRTVDARQHDHSEENVTPRRTGFLQLPDWTHSNMAAVVTSLLAGASAFASTWFLMSPAVETTDRHVLLALVIGNVFVASTLILLVAVRIWHLWSDRRNQLAGSKLHLQLVWLFSIVAVVPAAVAFLFAFSILRMSLNDVFSKRIDDYVETAREIANGLVESRVADMRREMLNTAADVVRNELSGYGFDGTPISFRKYLLDVQMNARQFSALTVLDGNFKTIARIEAEPGEYVLPDFATLRQLSEMEVPEAGALKFNPSAFSFGANDPRALDYWRGVMKVPVYDGGYLIAYKRISPQVSERLRGVRAMNADWQEAEQGRYRLERVFTAGYVLLGLTVLFGAVWTALSAANQMVTPISRLVKMADRVSSGDLAARVEVKQADGEIGALARSMNHMTIQLQNQRNDLIDTNRRFDRRRRFTEAVLSGVSAGVMGVGADGRISIANRSAADLLGVNATRVIGEKLEDLSPEIVPLFERALAAPEKEIGDQIDFHRDGRNATLNVRIVRDTGGDDQTFVVTFDDITQLIMAQRNAAWGDVARRIAHEIKNPLTPIQLSAERLRRKYLHEVTSSPEVFDKCTETIIRQVSDIGRMVDEFSSFARMPKPVINREDMRELAKAALFPQRVTFPFITFDADLPATSVGVNCDGRLIVQALTNLIKNAAESVSARLGIDEEHAANQQKLDTDDGTVSGRIVVRLSEENETVRLDIIDNGIGLPKEERHRLVEPYMTTRVKGTGLGLAIVKKVAEEHGGSLTFDDDTSLGPSGARITLTLPLAQDLVHADEVSADPRQAAE